MLLYRKSLVCDLSQTFDETGVLLQQCFYEGSRPQFMTIDTETNHDEEIDENDLPFPLELEIKVPELSGVKQQLRLYELSLPILVLQFFDEKGKPLGQVINDYIDDYGLEYGFGYPFGSVADWNGRKMKSTNLERDDDLPFPHFPLPFEYVRQVELNQPEKLTVKEKRLIKKYL